MKPFRAFLAEQDQDYEYKLCSVENIHTTDVLANIRLALGRYGLIELTPNGVQTQVKDSKFSDYPFMPVYVTKVVMVNPISSNSAAQSISLFTRIKDDKIKLFDKDDEIVMDGSENDPHTPVEVDSKDAQSEVGDAHAQSLMSDLMKEITKSREEKAEVPVYEGFTASHHDVTKILGRKVRSGFYLAEKDESGYGIMRGPFKMLPENYDYVETLPSATVIESHSIDSIMEYKVKYSDADVQQSPDQQKEVGSTKEIEVVDQDTGKSHMVVVTALDDDIAREKAVAVLAAKMGISKGRLLPKSA